MNQLYETPESRLIVSMRTETFKQILGTITRLIDDNGEIAPLARQAVLGCAHEIERKWPAAFRSCSYVSAEIARIEKRLAELKEIQSRCP